MPDTSGLVTTTVFSTKIIEAENKIPNTNNVVTTAVPKTKINEVEKKILIILNILLLKKLIS